ncbi:MAG: DDE-type integrase/transposase/recombinase [Candidatus Paceibacterota bacterium]
MAQTVQEERWRWIKPIITKEMTLKNVAKVCPHSARSLKRWKKAYEQYGIDGLAPRSTAPKTQPNETSIQVKEMVISLRKETGLCAKKLHWKLRKQGIDIPVRTIGKILKDEGLVRKYRTKKVKYKYLKAKRQPGELLEMDVKYVPGPVQGRKYYQYTVIDTATRWRHLEIFDEQCTHHAIRMMEIVRKRFPHQIKAIKTDNHTTFTNYYVGTNKRSDVLVKTIHPLDEWCAGNDIIHYLIDPGKPAQNGTVERSHREDEEKFYQKQTFRSKADLEKKLRRWNDYCNDLGHCALEGKTPNEMLYSKVPEVNA